MGFNLSRDLVAYHRSLLADRVRTERYREALSATVKAGDVVVDIGCGTGILSFFACRAGARRVYAIESGDVVELARRLAKDNGLEDRIIFVHEASTRVELPERADVVVTETLWNFGLGEGIVRALADARRRFLREGGTVVPRAIELAVAPVELHGDYDELKIWDHGLYELDFSGGRRHAVNNVYMPTIQPEALLASAQTIRRIDLALPEQEVDEAVSFIIARDGALHGIGGWFNAELTARISLSNVPPTRVPSWKHAFFPLEHEVAVQAGDVLTFSLRSVEEGAAWRWQTEYRPGNGDGEVLRSDQSTLMGFILSSDDLAKSRAGYAPRLSRRGEAELFVLSAFDGSRTIEALEEDVLRLYPEVCRSRKEASAFVREIVARAA